MQKSVDRDKEGHYIIINGTIQQDSMAILNIHISTEYWYPQAHKTSSFEHKDTDNSR
jgi:hypothetical protein